jgi:hypothetical protein
MVEKLEGIVKGVYIAADRKSFVSAPHPQVQVTFEGIPGDRHAGITMRSDGRTPYYPRGTEIRNSRQVSIVSVEELAEVAREMGIDCIQAEWLGANLLIEGVPNLTALPPATKLFFPDGAALVISKDNGPCIGPGKEIQSHYPEAGKIAELFPKVALHKRGLVAVVERPGTIAAGEVVRVEIP